MEKVARYQKQNNCDICKDLLFDENCSIQQLVEFDVCPLCGKKVCHHCLKGEICSSCDKEGEILCVKFI